MSKFLQILAKILAFIGLVLIALTLYKTAVMAREAADAMAAPTPTLTPVASLAGSRGFCPMRERRWKGYTPGNFISTRTRAPWSLPPCESSYARRPRRRAKSQLPSSI